MSNIDKFLLGIDSGLTVTKAVLFDTKGCRRAVSTVRVPRHTPAPRHVERDMEQAWDLTAQAIKNLLDANLPDHGEILGIGVTGHGDGLYAIDDQLRPVRHAILSLDGRAHAILEEWRESGVLEDALRLTGQKPLVSSPAPLLAWLKENEPQHYREIEWVMSCKDWLRFKLTGVVSTDITEASASFTNVETQRYDEGSLSLYNLDEVSKCLPPVAECSEVVGHVTRDAARKTGLPLGLPVVAGLHDVTAAAIGMGVTSPGTLSVVAGTYSINEVISTEPVRQEGWACRNSFRRGEWMNMAISPASSSNIDWFLQNFCKRELEIAEESDQSVFDLLQEEVESAFADSSQVIFHPFLYGSPLSDSASSGFFGIRGWHERGHMMRAVYEGISFNHRMHVEALASRFSLSRARAGGGGAQNPLLIQLFADNFAMPIEITQERSVSALGAALCAGVGAGVYETINDAVSQAVAKRQEYRPDHDRKSRLDGKYKLYCRVAEALSPLWDRLDSEAPME